MVNQTLREHGAHGGARSAVKPRGGEQRVAASQPFPQVQERLFWSEDGLGMQGGGRAVHSEGALSLHCEGRRSDVVLISSRSRSGGYVTDRSSWFEHALHTHMLE